MSLVVEIRTQVHDPGGLPAIESAVTDLQRREALFGNEDWLDRLGMPRF